MFPKEESAHKWFESVRCPKFLLVVGGPRSAHTHFAMKVSAQPMARASGPPTPDWGWEIPFLYTAPYGSAGKAGPSLREPACG